MIFSTKVKPKNLNATIECVEKIVLHVCEILMCIQIKIFASTFYAINNG